MEKTPQNCAIAEEDDWRNAFLPESLIKLVMKIAKVYNFSSIDEFSLMDTLQFTIFKNIHNLNIVDEKSMTIFILNIVMITDKFNRTKSTLTEAELDQICQKLDISGKELYKQEFAVFKTMEYQIQTPVVVEMIYDFIEKHMTEYKKKHFIYEMALDVMRIVYVMKKYIYEW